MAQATDTFTVFVTRHAEKADQPKDPELSQLGQQRALNLAMILQHVPLQTIYTTPYRRTQQTAEPTATQHQVTLMTYAAGSAEQLVQMVLQQQQNTLVVGHSNTVPNLVRLFGGSAPELTEQDYGDLFVLHFVNGTVTTTRLSIPAYLPAALGQ